MNVRRLLAVLACAFGISMAQAAIVRGGGGYTNDGQDQEARLYITIEAATDDDPLSAESDQGWIVGYEFLPTPRESNIDVDDAELEPCAPGGLIVCSYFVGPGESRRFPVVASLFYGYKLTFPTIYQVEPQFDVIWRVSDETGTLKTFTFEDLDFADTDQDFELVLNGLPVDKDLTISAEFLFTVPDSYAFYKASDPYSGDIRNAPAGGHATRLGTSFSITNATRLRIDKDSIPADETPPVTSASQSPLANGNGWNNTPVDVTITANDEAGGSGLAFVGYQVGLDSDSSPTSPVVVHLDSEGTSTVDYFAEDVEGNVAATKSHTVKIDHTNPTSTAGAAPSPNADGWNNSDVTVSFTCLDGLSGIATCPANQLLTTDTTNAGQIVSGVATDKAGNTSAQASVTVKLDKTVPTISGAATTSPNGAGWYKTNVTVHFTCSDLLSLVKTCEADKTLSASGASQSTSGSATDLAGNTANATVSGINIDKIDPVVSVTGVTDGATYAPGAVPTAGCSTSDALSGVATAATLAVTGGTGNGVGSFTASCTGALDNAGNGGSASATYKVQYSYSGFFSPVDNLPYLNSVKAGQGVPVKFSLAGNFGLDILQGSPQSVKIQCSDSLPVDAIEQTVAAGGSSLSYDPVTDQYSYTWKTDKAYKGSCRSLAVTLDDGTVHTALFKFN